MANDRIRSRRVKEVCVASEGRMQLPVRNFFCLFFTLFYFSLLPTVLGTVLRVGEANRFL